ncbi:MAG: hypothetical protein MZV70_00935 [Desulfobacterales bacterium]|nr:hypothetical protein [Desulfobacterales bacterium]
MYLPWKRCPACVVFPVEVLRISLVDSLKDLRQARLPGFDKQVDVVAHQHIGVQKESHIDPYSR